MKTIILDLFWDKLANGGSLSDIIQIIDGTKYYWRSYSDNRLILNSTIGFLESMKRVYGSQLNFSANQSTCYKFKDDTVLLNLIESLEDKELAKEASDVILNENSKELEVLVRCPLCNKISRVKLRSIKRNQSFICPECARKFGGYIEDRGILISERFPWLEKDWCFDNRKPFNSIRQLAFTEKFSVVCPSCGKKHYKSYEALSKSGNSLCISCSRVQSQMQNSGSLRDVYPEVADVWDNSDNMPESDKISFSSTRVGRFNCSNSGIPHYYMRSVSEVTASYEKYGKIPCPICANKEVFEGVNDFATVYNELLPYWDYNNNPKSPQETLCTNRSFFGLICPNCGKHHTKRKDAVDRSGAYCGGCANAILAVKKGKRKSLKMVYPKIAEQFDKGDNPILSDEIAPTSNKIFNFYCDGIAGGLKPHIFSKPLYNMVHAIQQGTKTGGCPICSGKQVLSGINDFATMAPELAKEWDYDLNELKPEDVYYRDAKRYHFICNKGGHHFTRDPLHMMRSHEIGTNGCPVCHGKVVEVGSNDLYTTHKEKVDNEWEYDINDILPTEVTAGSQRLIWRHCKNKRCNKIFQTTVFNWVTDGVVCCEDCRNRSYSLAEKEICDYISNLGFDIVEEARIFYDRLSLDILLEKEKIAFEYNGLYWHSTAVRGEDFHKNKYDMACKCGIDLYMIWEDDYLYRKDVVLKRIKDILGVQEIEINLEDCMIDIIREDEAKDFIENYGLFKGFTGKYYLGVYKNRELIAVSAISDREDNDDAYIEGYCEKYKIESGFLSIINYIEEYMHASGIVAKVENATIDWNVIGMDGFVKIKEVEPEFTYLNEHSILRVSDSSEAECKIYDAGYSVYYKVNNK